MPTISLNMIVKDEEKFLEGCLEGIKNLVDEIVVGDTGSSDNTIEISKKFTSNIFQIEWNNNFAEARNAILEKSKGDWILYLDADERIDSIFHETIKRMVNDKDIDAYLLKLRSVINTETGAQVHIVPYPRLFRNLPGLKFEGIIHEQITPALVKKKARFKTSEVMIEHLGYSQDKKILDEKKKRNLNGLLELIRKEPENSYAYFQLGQTYMILNREEEGHGCFIKALEIGTLTNPVKASTNAILSQYYFNRKDFSKADEYSSESLKIAPHQIFARLLQAEILYSTKNFDAALLELAKALQYVKIPENKRRSDVAVDVNYRQDFIYYKIGKIFLAQDKIEDAAENFHKCVDLNNDFEEPKSELAGIYFKKEEFDKCFGILNKVNIRKINKITLLMNIAGFYEEMKKYVECSSVLEHVISIDPKNSKALFFLGNCHLFLNDLERAEQYFSKSHQISPEVSETIQNLAVIYIKKNNFQKAYEEFLKLEKLFPDDEGIKRKIEALKTKILLTQ